MNKKIVDRYTSARSPGSFSAVSGFLKNNKDLDRQAVIKQLASMDAVTAHKPQRKHFARNKFISSGIDDIWQADLVDLSKLKYSNSHCTFLLTCIDIFSKFAWVVPLKSKSGENTRDGFVQILAQGRKPNKIQVDRGNEFKGECKKFLAENNIEVYFTYSVIKAGVVERFNRTLEEKIFRMLSATKSKKYIDKLQDLVHSYNNSYHRSIKMNPAQVNRHNEDEVRQNLYGDLRDQTIEFEFDLGDYVKINKEKKLFEKGYTDNWESDIYIISKQLPRIPPVYKVKRLDGSELYGVYYKEELQRVNYVPFDTFEVLNENNSQLLVKQLNSSQQSESWVDKEQFLQ